MVNAIAGHVLEGMSGSEFAAHIENLVTPSTHELFFKEEEPQKGPLIVATEDTVQAFMTLAAFAGNIGRDKALAESLYHKGLAIGEAIGMTQEECTPFPEGEKWIVALKQKTILSI